MDFALGLHEYDLSNLQPHFPGYPVYIFISWLFFKLLHNDVWALATPGVFFGSLTVYPLSLLTKQLFSEKVAILTTVLYIINPLCWLQAERPTSDTIGLFFVILSTYFLYCVFDLTNKNSNHPSSNNYYNPTSGKRIYLFLGSLFIGLGFGVRLSYLPFMVLWVVVLFYLVIQKMHFETRCIFYGITGFIIGVCSWFIPQIIYIGWYPFWQNGIFFSHGHFTDWGGSVITFGGLERIACLAKSLVACGLGGWWCGFSFLRLIPTVIMIISIIYFFKRYRSDCRGFFLGVYTFPYLLWIIFGQNVANPRHIMPIVPVMLMLIACGLCKAYEEDNKGISVFLITVFIASISVVSFKLVIRYRDNIPAPIRLIQFIEGKFNSSSTRIYCSNGKRLFDYYMPQWDVREVRNEAGLIIDLKSSLCKPQNILVVHTQEEINQLRIKRQPIKMFDGNPYTDDAKEGLSLYEWKGL